MINRDIDLYLISTIDININAKGARKAISTGMVPQARCIVGKICSTDSVYCVLHSNPEGYTPGFLLLMMFSAVLL